ncbi:hypothetical protein QYE76_062115 [Lolium multiflorum]|uniref:Uncharacterized protein n=1 Tax=Lolium multiflorum TaxID=4521 RepID=A0AAD8S4M8_LOLMU|nr:hypothetical protein QYE76_062115 [Lolium multiflorum]
MLSTRANLFYKGCAPSAVCAACPMQETGRHLFFDCSIATEDGSFSPSFPTFAPSSPINLCTASPPPAKLEAMDLFELPPATGHVAQPQPPPPMALAVCTSTPTTATFVPKKRKHTGTHLVAPGASMAASVVAAMAKATMMPFLRARPKMGGDTDEGGGQRQAVEGRREEEEACEAKRPSYNCSASHPRSAHRRKTTSMLPTCVGDMPKRQ